MRLILPPVPAKLRRCVIGQIVESANPADLGQDMVDILLPSGVLIHAGWYPESSPNGAYRITVARGLSYLVSPLTTPDADEAAQDVAELATRFAEFPYADGVCDAETTYDDFAVFA